MSGKSFLAGQKVQWTHVQHFGNGAMRLSAREGTVVEAHFAFAKVKLRNGRKVTVAIERLEAAGQPNQLTRMMEQISAAVGKGAA